MLCSRVGSMFEQAAHFSIRRGLTLKLTSLSLDTNPEMEPAIREEWGKLVLFFGHSGKARFQSMADSVFEIGVIYRFLNLYMIPIPSQKPNPPSIHYLSPHWQAQHTRRTSFRWLYPKIIPSAFEGSTRFSITSRLKHRKILSGMNLNRMINTNFVFIIPDKGSFGEKFQEVRSTLKISIPQHADTSKVVMFEGFPQYVCRLDVCLWWWWRRRSTAYSKYQSDFNIFINDLFRL